MAAPRNRRNLKYDVTTRYPVWVHADVLYWAEDWEKIRDCLLGEREVKAKSTYYLPQLEAQSWKEYESYLDRAVFYNMVSRTVNGMVGSVYRRAPKVQNIPKRLDASLKNIARSGVSLTQILKMTVRELAAMGRYGWLVDMDRDGVRPPYIAPYAAENILDWVTAEIDGREVPVRIILRDIGEVDKGVGARRDFQFTFRVLELGADRIYRQKVYRTDSIHADLTHKDPDAVITPTRRGKPLDFIPFVFFGSETITPDVDRSPVIDIVNLNLSHYKSYAHLEHGRFYTGLPIYYAQTQGDDGETDYVIGPNVVWECAVGEKPGIIEFNGAGLKYLENACVQKETQIAALGGRILGGQERSTAESDNAVMLKDKNERSILLNIVNAVDEGASRALNWWAWWQDEDKAKVEVEHNTAFLLDGLGARELRAVYLMYKEGAVPVTVLYEYLLKAEAIPDYISVDEFKRLLNDESEFPNNPDVAAKRKGYVDAKHRTNKLQTDRQMRLDEEVADKKFGIDEQYVELDVRSQDLAETQHDDTVALDEERLKLEKKKAEQPPVPKEVSSLRASTGNPMKKKPAKAK